MFEPPFSAAIGPLVAAIAGSRKAGLVATRVIAPKPMMKVRI